MHGAPVCVQLPLQPQVVVEAATGKSCAARRACLPLLPPRLQRAWRDGHTHNYSLRHTHIQLCTSMTPMTSASQAEQPHLPPALHASGRPAACQGAGLLHRHVTAGGVSTRPAAATPAARKHEQGKAGNPWLLPNCCWPLHRHLGAVAASSLGSVSAKGSAAGCPWRARPASATPASRHLPRLLTSLQLGSAPLASPLNHLTRRAEPHPPDSPPDSCPPTPTYHHHYRTPALPHLLRT